MALPCYVSTEWVGLGHATLRFRSKKVSAVVADPEKERPARCLTDESLSQAPDSQPAGENGPSPHPGKGIWSWLSASWDYSVPLFSRPKEDQHPVKTHNIECYLSAVYIGEYGKRKSKVSKGCKETSQHQEGVEEHLAPSTKQEADLVYQNAVNDNLLTHTESEKDDLRPPGVVPEVWNAWLDHWEAWKEVLIPLSWVHKYRNHCTPEYITWHDSYLKDYPEVLPLITEELGSSELYEDTMKQTPVCEATKCDSDVDLTEFYDYMYDDNENGGGRQKAVDDEPGVSEEPEHTSDENTDMNTAADDTGGESKNRQMLDDLYTKHTKKRYLVHLRSFLHRSGVECGQDIDMFFEREAGIKFSIQTSGEACRDEMHTTEGSSPALKGEPCQGEEEDTWNSKENNYCSHGETKLTLNENTTPPCDRENECKCQEEQMELTREATMEKAAETSTYDELHLNSSSVPQELSDSGRESCQEDLSCEDKRTEPHVSGATEVVSGSSDDEEESVFEEVQTDAHKVSVSSGQKHKTSKRRRRKKDTTRPQGMSWALKYVQEKAASHDEEVTSQSSGMASVSLKSPEAVPGFLKEETLRIPDAASENPDAAPGTLDAVPGIPDSASGTPDAASGTPNAAPGTPDVASGTPNAAPGTPDAASGTPDAASGTPDAAPGLTWQEKINAIVEETVDVTEFFNWMDEHEKKAQKKYYEGVEREALHKALQEPPTFLAKMQTICYGILDRAAVNLKKVLLPFTALHFLNVAFPGAAAVEYESSVTEEVPGERQRLKNRFDDMLFEQKIKLRRNLLRITKFCLMTLKGTVVPVGVHHLTNLVFLTASEIEYQFPPAVFGVWWLPKPDASFCVEGKNIKRHQRRFHRWLEVQNPNLPPSCTVELRGMVMHRVNPDPDTRKSQRVYQQVVRQEGGTEDGQPHLTLQTLHPLSKDSENAEVEAWNKIISGCQRLSYWEAESSLPSDLPQDIHKYWAQRYRLFLKYNEGIRLDSESWYSVTPEFLAAHQARRCSCEVVVDAMCGAGGNAIQLAKTCGRVIAIDKDPRKVELARHNAEVYGVADHIEFRVGNFFKLAPYLKADVVYLSPPWGGMEYLEEGEYNVYRLGGTMNCARLLRAARGITPSVALYLPRNSDLCQVIALAGLDGVVDIETNFMGPKKKAITAYFGDLAAKCF